MNTSSKSTTSAAASPVEILTKARELLSDEARWIKGNLARDAGGRECEPESTSAVCWCAVGALERLHSYGEARGVAKAALRKASGRDAIVSFNDDLDTTHADILAWFDRAIALAGTAS